MAVRTRSPVLDHGGDPVDAGTGAAAGLVTLAQMVRTLVNCVERPPGGERIIAVPEIREA